MRRSNEFLHKLAISGQDDTHREPEVALATAGGAPTLASVSVPTGTISGLLWSKDVEELEQGAKERKCAVGEQGPRLEQAP